MGFEHMGQPLLDKARHVKYWTRCLKTLLPHHYTGNESNRMYLAFFIISALDLLGAWDSVTNENERNEYVNWIYHCQHPTGGFRMWPGTDFGALAGPENAKWDPANVPATYFALAALLIVGDDLQRVNRRKTLDWLRKMQRDDGSFGETLIDGCIEGGMDPRFGYCATGARRILRGCSDGPLTIDGVAIDDIDTDALVRCVQQSESFDGGIADQAFHEPHAGYTFCALGCIKFVHRLSSTGTADNKTPTAPVDPSMTLRWLAARQTDLMDPDAELDDDDDDTAMDAGQQSSSKDGGRSGSGALLDLHQSPDKSHVPTIPSPFAIEPLEAGMNGRSNKVADTCYAWWVAASFHMLDQSDTYNKLALQHYLLDKTQHPALGGFGKYPGDLPDLYHSYLGLAALGLGGHPDLKDVDSCMCVSKDASSRIAGLWET